MKYYITLIATWKALAYPCGGHLSDADHKKVECLDELDHALSSLACRLSELFFKAYFK